MIENGRAKAAYDYCLKCNKSIRSEYRTRVMNMPFMIKTNGLAGAFAFLLSKKDKEAYTCLYQNIMDWLIKKELISDRKRPNSDERDNHKLLEQLLVMDSVQYRKITVETMALLNWMKRFCDSLNAISDKKEQ